MSFFFILYRGPSDYLFTYYIGAPRSLSSLTIWGPLRSVSSLTIWEPHSDQFLRLAVGQLTRMAEPIPPSGQSSWYSLTTLSSSSSTDRRAETDRKVITTRIAVAQHFRCRLRRRESCILGATSSQPTLPLHELPPARLVIHRQTSAHERRKGTLSVQSRSGILADFCPRQH